MRSAHEFNSEEAQEAINLHRKTNDDLSARNDSQSYQQAVKESGGGLDAVSVRFLAEVFCLA